MTKLSKKQKEQYPFHRFKIQIVRAVKRVKLIRSVGGWPHPKDMDTLLWLVNYLAVENSKLRTRSDIESI